MTNTPAQLIDQFGPDRCDEMSVEQARIWCARLTRGHYENFSVLTRLVPARLRDDFACVYAFCRWADDLGDEMGDRGTELLGWWRSELDDCYRGVTRHPVFVALRPTIERLDLPIEAFADLISAFQLDQNKQRYQSWAELLEYCRLSADPVGRLVLMLFEMPRTDELFKPSDCICTALQLTNHLQDVRRDILERNRIYLPREMFPNDTFEQRLISSANQGWGVDRQILQESREIIKTCVDRTWKLFEQGEPLLGKLSDEARPVVELFASGGCHVLRQIEHWNYETALHRPRLGPMTRVKLLMAAWWRAQRANRAGART